VEEYLSKISYDKNDPPPTEEDKPVDVNVLVLLKSVREVNKKDYTFRMKLGFEIGWNDTRLNDLWSYVNSSEAFLTLRYGDMADKVWLPGIEPNAIKIEKPVNVHGEVANRIR